MDLAAFRNFSVEIPLQGLLVDARSGDNGLDSSLAIYIIVSEP